MARYLSILQFLVSAGTFFIPTQSEEYELYSEGSFCLSQLISVLQRQQGNIIGRGDASEGMLRRICTFISTSEVFLEKLSSSLMGNKARVDLICAIESSKAIMRVIMVMNRSEASMLINWARESETGKVLLLSHYSAFYKQQAAIVTMGNSAAVSGDKGGNFLYDEFDNHDSSDCVEDERLLSPSFVGKRSGIVLKIASPVSVRPFPISPGSAGGTNNSSIPTIADDHSLFSEDVSALPHTQIEQECAEQQDNSPASLVDAPDELSFSPERLLMLGEILYILRPAIHAISMRQLDELTDDQAAAAETTATGTESRPFTERTKTFLKKYAALLISLIIEILSINLTSTALAAVVRKQTVGCTPLNYKSFQKHPFDEELGRRKARLFVYLVRSPVFDSTTFPALLYATFYLRKIPVIGGIVEYVINAAKYVNKTHFYSSASS